MFRAFLLVLLATLSFRLASGQTPVGCPSISVSGPAWIPRHGELVTFTASVKGVDPALLSYVWHTSVNKPFSGQGTSTIEIEFSDEASGSLTVSVEVIGLPQGCLGTASETLHWDGPPEPEKIGALTSLKQGAYEVDLKRFADEIHAKPDHQAYIFVTHLRSARPVQIASREKVVISGLATNGDRRFDRSRITIVRYPANKEIVEFWLVPPGANNPQCAECK